MDDLLKKLLDSSGISGYEKEVADIIQQELSKSCEQAAQDKFGNVIGRKGNGKRKIMLAAHMDEVGFVVKHVTSQGYIKFVKIGGIDDRILPGQRVVVKTAKGDLTGIIGAKPPHTQKEEERKLLLKHEDMFIDIGSAGREETLKRVRIADQIVFEPKTGMLSGRLAYGKAVDDRVGCYVLLKVMESIDVDAQIFAVATAQEEVGLKGARTSSFSIDPEFAIAVDTTVAGDIPSIKEEQSSLKLGSGVSIGTVEAGGRGFIISSKVKDLFIGTAVKNNIKHQIDVLEGGMTDAAMISINREGILTGVLSIPVRYVHSPAAVFHLDDVEAAIKLTIKSIEEFLV